MRNKSESKSESKSKVDSKFLLVEDIAERIEFQMVDFVKGGRSATTYRGIITKTGQEFVVVSLLDPETDEENENFGNLRNQLESGWLSKEKYNERYFSLLQKVTKERYGPSAKVVKSLECQPLKHIRIRSRGPLVAVPLDDDVVYYLLLNDPFTKRERVKEMGKAGVSGFLRLERVQE